MSAQPSQESEALTSAWSGPVCACCGKQRPMSGAGECCDGIGPTSRSTTTSEQSESVVGCLTPWAEMGEAMRVYDAATGKPTVKPHNILIFTIQDTREMKKAQNGMGVADGNVAYTLDQTGAQGVAIVSKEKEDRSLKGGVPTSSRIYDAEAGVAPTLQAANNPNRGGTDGPIIVTSSAAFSAGQGAAAGSIAYEQEMAPTLKAAASGSNQVPVALISSQADFRARTSPLPESDEDLQASGQDSSLSSPGSQMSFDQVGSSLRTSLGSSPLPTDETWESFSQRWPKSGTASAGEWSTLDTSEFPSDAVECSLSDVLETTVPQRYALSARAAKGILRRANARGRELPAELKSALQALAATE